MADYAVRSPTVPDGDPRGEHEGVEMQGRRAPMTLKSVTSTPERDDRRLTKSATGRKVAGVCSGLARYFDTDATLVRLIFAGLTLLGGSGVVIYLIAWMIMPAASSIDDMLGQLRRLGELKDAGVLTEAEFQTQKAKILAD